LPRHSLPGPGGTTAGQTWYKFVIPLASFNCKNGNAGSLANVNRVDFASTDLRDAFFCLDGIALVK
jgi:hypothetical protein